MLGVLQLNDPGILQLNKTNGKWISQLGAVDSSVDVAIANSIWYNALGKPPLSSFLDMNTRYYRAKVQGADFSDSRTAERINQWVSNQTRRKIRSVVDHVSPGDVMYLINAVYFDGKWKVPFDTDRLDRQRFFHLVSGDSVKTDFMFKQARFNYFGNERVQMVEIPYGNGDFNMDVLLPSETLSVQDLALTWTEDSLDRYRQMLDSVAIDIRLPVWEYRYQMALAPALTEMGMGKAFGSRADFSNMYPAGAYRPLSEVLQKTYVKVDARGTEAAAATGTIVIGYSSPTHPKPPPVMDVNRPFLYLISEKKSHAILFVGLLYNPREG